MPGSCGWYTDADGTCGQPGVARFVVGPRCAAHTPAALAGRPEPVPPPPVPPSPRYAPTVLPRRWEDAECVPCVHCRILVAPVNVELFGVDEHLACTPPPRSRRGVTVWREGDPEPWSRELIETRTRQLRANPNRRKAA